MPSLEVLQRAFASEIEQDETMKLSQTIVDDEVSAEMRINVYRNNFKANLRSALASTYPVIRKLVGPEFFRYLADTYAKEHPSRSGDIRHFGRKLPDFLLDLESVTTLPYLRDIARLEWVCSAVSAAASPVSESPESFEMIALADIADLRFGARAASRLVCSKYPIFSIWLVNQESHDGDKSVTLEEGAQSVLVVRPGLELELWQLDEAESVFAGALVAGKTLTEAVDVVTLSGHDVNLNKLFGKYLRNGTPLFSTVDVREPSEIEGCDNGSRP